MTGYNAVAILVLPAGSHAFEKLMALKPY